MRVNLAVVLTWAERIAGAIIIVVPAIRKAVSVLEAEVIPTAIDEN